MDITKVGVHHLPKFTHFFICENGKFYISEDNWVWFSTFRDRDELKLQQLFNEQSALESELDHCKDIYQREDILIELDKINSLILNEQRDENAQPYKVKVTDEQFPAFLSKMKEAKKDSVWSIAWKMGCPIDFGPNKKIIPNNESFPREWLSMKKD